MGEKGKARRSAAPKNLCGALFFSSPSFPWALFLYDTAFSAVLTGEVVEVNVDRVVYIVGVEQAKVEVEGSAGDQPAWERRGWEIFGYRGANTGVDSKRQGQRFIATAAPAK